MHFNLTKFSIKGLFGATSYDIPIENNKLVLVAENGSGKTTIVNIVYYFLSRQWTKLLRYKFDSITAEINGDSIKLNRNDIDYVSSEKIKRFLRRFPDIESRIRDLIVHHDVSKMLRSRSQLEFIKANYELPVDILLELANSANREQENLFSSAVAEKEKTLSAAFDTQILYLPTYRRIEQDLKSIFPDLDEDIYEYRKRRKFIKTANDTSYVELVEFGMEDVVEKINDRLKDIQNNLNYKLKNDLAGTYLRDVINKRYEEIKYEQVKSFNEDDLLDVFNRIDDTVLAGKEKEKLKDFVRSINEKGTIDKEENRIIAYFIFRLSEIYNELKKEEEDIIGFINICNEYVSNKKFIYDNNNFNIKIKFLIADSEDSTFIDFKDLSSGEKQIVSLFSHIYLSKKRNYFIIIDEPELSLSVPWQQRFLSDILAIKYCKGLIAVTHSPFIFENSLEQYTHSLNEFIISKNVVNELS